MKPHTFHPEADQEYANAARYYNRIDPKLGGPLYDEIDRLISDVRQQPSRFRLFDPPARRHFSDVYPYAVIYVDQPGPRIDPGGDAFKTASGLLETST